MSEYTPGKDSVEMHYVTGAVAANPGLTQIQARAEIDRFLARVKRDAAREALDGLSVWLGDLAEKHPARSAHVPLMQGHITRYITDNHPEEQS